MYTTPFNLLMKAVHVFENSHGSSPANFTLQKFSNSKLVTNASKYLSRSRRNNLISRILESMIITAIGCLTYALVLRYYSSNFNSEKNETDQDLKSDALLILKSKKLSHLKLNKYEMVLATSIILPNSNTAHWSDVAGFDDIIEDIKETVILPFLNKELFCNKTNLIKPLNGMLLYGPPGCGKTSIARAIAHETNCNFINVDVSSLMDKWFGETEKRAQALFSLASKLKPCILFIDEIDAFLRVRRREDHECTSYLKVQFMTFWDGILNKSPDILIIGATNRMEDVDPAIIRRFQIHYHIPIPNKSSRIQILEKYLIPEKIDELDFIKLASLTEGFSGSDLYSLCRKAAMYNMKTKLKQESNDNFCLENMKNLEFGPIVMTDFYHCLNISKQAQSV
ncbi:hypothetical protein A3Q56_01175 [Intoshia linei]|uniref:AAA+ ATPase domain-containing protein n=1 Tax=Intoshia linei TaxID=1819745 RepID=A0A177B9W9_9BILA|nr:hypothetical protein A3Q56_01175 [Intoshia linei]